MGTRSACGARPDTAPGPMLCPIAEGLSESQGLCPAGLYQKLEPQGPARWASVVQDPPRRRFRVRVHKLPIHGPSLVAATGSDHESGSTVDAATVAEVLAAQARDSERLGSFRVGGCLQVSRDDRASATSSSQHRTPKRLSPPQVSTRKTKSLRQLELSLLKDRD